MKKVISIISVVAAAASLAACNVADAPEENISDNSNSSLSTISSQSTTSLQSSTFLQSTSSTEESIPLTPLPENAIAPDGSTVNFSEAIKFEQTPQDTYIFDYAFVRLAEGSLYTTNEDPALYNWETKEFEKNLPTYEPKYIKVKVGDTLANGLVVTGVYCAFINYPEVEHYNGFTMNVVNFGNKNTELTGYLRYVPYTDETVYYYFYADPSQSDPIPISFRGENNSFGFKMVNEEEKFAAMGDHTLFKFEIPENTEIDHSKIVPNKFIKVKVKVSEISVLYDTYFGERISAILDDIEIL